MNQRKMNFTIPREGKMVSLFPYLCLEHVGGHIKDFIYVLLHVQLEHQVLAVF